MMNHKTKKTMLIILGITAIIFSRLVFYFFDDPEGPNLLIVMLVAVVLYFASLMSFAYSPSVNSSKRLWLAISIQVVLVTSLYFLGITF